MKVLKNMISRNFKLAAYLVFGLALATSCGKETNQSGQEVAIGKNLLIVKDSFILIYN